MLHRRVLIAGEFVPGALAGSYARAFQALGCETFCFDSLSVYREAGLLGQNRLLRRVCRGFFWRQLNRAFEQWAVSLKPALLVATKCCFLEPDTVRRVQRRLGVPLCNVYPDHPFCGVPLDPRNGASTERHNLIEVFREYTVVFLWEQSLCYRLRANGVHTAFLPFGVDPEVFCAHGVSPCPACSINSRGIVFAGHYNPKRGKHLSAVVRHSVDLWGGGWTRMQHSARRRHRLHRVPARGPALGALYAQAAVSLNVVGDLNIPGHNMRTFEIPASGGVMLAHYTREQDSFFPEDEAAAYYRVPEELDDKIEWLLGDAPLRQRIRRNAARIAAQHTYQQRARTILREFSLHN